MRIHIRVAFDNCMNRCITSLVRIWTVPGAAHWWMTQNAPKSICSQPIRSRAPKINPFTGSKIVLFAAPNPFTANPFTGHRAWPTPRPTRGTGAHQGQPGARGTGPRRGQPGARGHAHRAPPHRATPGPTRGTGHGATLGPTRGMGHRAWGHAGG